MATRSWGRWLARHGLKDGIGLSLVRTLQPVAVVADERNLTTPLLGPQGMVGSLIAGVPINHASVLMRCLTPVRIDAVLISALSEITFGVGASPYVQGAAVTSVIQESQPNPTAPVGSWHTTLWNAGTTLAAPPTNTPRLGPVPLTGPIFVPAGGFFSIRHATAGQPLSWVVTFSELPEPLAQ